MKQLIYGFILVLAYATASGQDMEFVVTPAVADPGEVSRRMVFDGNSLWGYINGGADIYLEYGFTSLTMHEIVFMGKPIRFDLYEMTDPAAAWGIFTVYSYMCDTDTGPGEFNCATRWQIQAVKGKYYLSAILATGTAEEFKYASDMAAFLMEKIDESLFEPGYPFRKGVFSGIKRNIKYCRGRLGLENGIPFRNEALSGAEFSDLWHITGIDEYEELSITVIRFRDAGKRALFLGLQDADDMENTEIIPLSDGFTLLMVTGGNNGLPVENLAEWFEGTGEKW